jgi:hypothetical protein
MVNGTPAAVDLGEFAYEDQFHSLAIPRLAAGSPRDVPVNILVSGYAGTSVSV